MKPNNNTNPRLCAACAKEASLFMNSGSTRARAFHFLPGKMMEQTKKWLAMLAIPRWGPRRALMAAEQASRAATRVFKLSSSRLAKLAASFASAMRNVGVHVQLQDRTQVAQARRNGQALDAIEGSLGDKRMFRDALGEMEIVKRFAE